MRFLQPRSHLGLSAETFLERRVGGQLRAQQLDRDHPTLDRVVGPVHLAHSPRADQ